MANPIDPRRLRDYSQLVSAQTATTQQSGPRDVDPSSVAFNAMPFPGADYFQRADANPHLRKTSVAMARPGDVFVLDDSTDVGHRAVVYSNVTCDPAKLNALASHYGAGVTAFATPGPVRMMEVDASWSAGRFGAEWGGIRRDTWLYNETSHQWAQINARASQPAFEITANGPASERLHGVYRFQ